MFQGEGEGGDGRNETEDAQAWAHQDPGPRKGKTLKEQFPHAICTLPGNATKGSDEGEGIRTKREEQGRRR